MGILLEADYKGVLQGKESIISGLQRAFRPRDSSDRNPLEREIGESLPSAGNSGDLTYEQVNRDSGL